MCWQMDIQWPRWSSAVTTSKPFGGIAVKAEELMSLGKDKGRELVRDQRLIYIYHDRIDMTGDKQASETKTFEAAAQTVQELSQLLGFMHQLAQWLDRACHGGPWFYLPGITAGRV
jgi:hypothetical protein